MSLGRFFSGALVLATALAPASPSAHAQGPPDEAAAGEAAAGEDDAELRDEEARTLFKAGRLAYADGRYEDAVDAFRRSYELSGKPELLFNIGSSLDRLRRNEEALEAYEQYLEEVPEASNREAVEARIEALRRAVQRERVQEAELRDASEREEMLQAQLAAEQEQDDAITEEWWFWTLVGVVVVGVTATAAILATDPGVEDPKLGSTGQVFFTLGSAP